MRIPRAMFFVAVGITAAGCWHIAQSQSASTPVRLTADEDHQRVETGLVEVVVGRRAIGDVAGVCRVIGRAQRHAVSKYG